MLWAQSTRQCSNTIYYLKTNTLEFRDPKDLVQLGLFFSYKLLQKGRVLLSYVRRGMEEEWLTGSGAVINSSPSSGPKWDNAGQLNQFQTIRTLEDGRRRRRRRRKRKRKEEKTHLWSFRWSRRNEADDIWRTDSLRGKWCNENSPWRSGRAMHRGFNPYICLRSWEFKIQRLLIWRKFDAS